MGGNFGLNRPGRGGGTVSGKVITVSPIIIYMKGKVHTHTQDTMNTSSSMMITPMSQVQPMNTLIIISMMGDTHIA